MGGHRVNHSGPTAPSALLLPHDPVAPIWLCIPTAGISRHSNHQRVASLPAEPTQELAIRVHNLDALTRRLGLEPQERGLLLLMCPLITALLTAYTIAKVQRDAAFIAEFGAGALPTA